MSEVIGERIDVSHESQGPGHDAEAYNAR